MRYTILASAAAVFFNLSSATGILDTSSSSSSSSSSNSILPLDQIPQKCLPTVELAEKEGRQFYQHLMSKTCDKGCAVSAEALLPELDNVVTEYLEFIWEAVSPPLDLNNEVLPFYQTLKNDCLLDPKWGVTQIADVCQVQTSDEKLNAMVQQCIMPKVQAKYMLRVDELADWAKENCVKGEAAIQKLLTQTRQGKEPKGSPNPYKLVNESVKNLQCKN